MDACGWITNEMYSVNKLFIIIIIKLSWSFKACGLGKWGTTSRELVLQCYLITQLVSLSMYACW